MYVIRVYLVAFQSFTGIMKITFRSALVLTGKLMVSRYTQTGTAFAIPEVKLFVTNFVSRFSKHPLVL